MRWCVLLLSGVITWQVDVGARAVPQEASQASATTAEAEALIRRFKEAAAADRMAAALDISQNYTAKLLLKTRPELQDAGGLFFDVMKGVRDPSGVTTAGFMDRVRVNAQGRLKDAGWSAAVVDRFDGQENRESRTLRKAPMDLDEGIPPETKSLLGRITNTNRTDLRGHVAVAMFTEEADQAYRAALVEEAGKLGKIVDPTKMGLTITTPLHPEAYRAMAVLERGGVADVSLIGQTAAVTSYKLDHLADAFKAAPGEALVEAARGTLKDLKKVSSAFTEVQLATGVAPELSAGNRTLIDALESIVARPEGAESLVANMEGGAAKFFERCKALIGNMESAFVLQGPVALLKVRLYQQFLPAAERRAAVIAVANGEPVPAVAARLDHELARISAARVVSVRPEEPSAFLRRLESTWKDLSFAPTNENVIAIMTRLDSLSEVELATLVGASDGQAIATARKALTPTARMNLYNRLLAKGSVETFEKSTFTLVQNVDHASSAAADRATLFFAGVVGLATGIAETVDITDRGLPADEESRAIVEAWAKALPFVGDVWNAVNRTGEALVTGDVTPLPAAVMSAVMAASWLVPQLQIPALVVFVGTGSIEGGWNAYKMYRRRDLLRTWVDSGQWDMSNGTLLGILDGRGGMRPVPPDSRAVQALFVDGDVPYHTASGFLSSTVVSGPRGRELLIMPIRESLVNYVNDSGFVKDERVQASITALKNLYPEFEPLAALALPRIEGRALLEKAALKHGHTAEKAALGIYAVLERAYLTAVEDALATLKADAEQEFQAKHMVGEARAVFERLNALGRRLGLPLVARVRAIETSLSSVAEKAMYTPWENHSIEVRTIENVQRFAEGYTRVDASIDQIRRAFAAAGIPPPAKFNLTGYLTIDEPRMRDLATTYTLALAQAAKDAEEAAALAKVPYEPSSNCASEIRLTLARLKAAQVGANDLMLLARQWSGSAAAASQSRDAEVERARGYIESNTPLPVAVWRRIAEKAEDAYAWANAPEAWAGSDFSNLETASREVLQRAEADYEAARRDAQNQFAAGCQSPKPTTKAGGVDGQDPAAICNCYAEWFSTKFAADSQKSCEARPATTSEDKCLQIVNTVTKPFTWVPERRNCVGSYERKWQYRAEGWITGKKGDVYWVGPEVHANEEVSLRSATEKCKEIRFTTTGVIVTSAPCGKKQP